MRLKSCLVGFGPILLQKSFCRRCQKFRGPQARFSCRDLRDLSPHAKLIGDFGNATEAARIIDLFAHQVFAKNSEPCNFRLLQHNRPIGDIGHLAIGRRTSEADHTEQVGNGMTRRSRGRLPQNVIGAEFCVVNVVFVSTLGCRVLCRELGAEGDFPWPQIQSLSLLGIGFATYQGFNGGSSPLAPPLTLPKSGVSAGGSPTLQYYVRFSLYNGTTVTVNGDQLFALKSFSFTDEQTLNIGSRRAVRGLARSRSIRCSSASRSSGSIRS